ncbi:hypothetical protein MOBT1_001244 [Malassezia obtusa]|uniref:Uncharacterized protein n=1 Tax=Malassezia obtusa TaxID=76774 RepID=A0AAF0E045_9BASI|nr:hypothetical protein MOBT1_001244 [Malassezia obtusa]
MKRIADRQIQREDGDDPHAVPAEPAETDNAPAPVPQNRPIRGLPKRRGPAAPAPSAPAAPSANPFASLATSASSGAPAAAAKSPFANISLSKAQPASASSAPSFGSQSAWTFGKTSTPAPSTPAAPVQKADIPSASSDLEFFKSVRGLNWSMTKALVHTLNESSDCANFGTMLRTFEEQYSKHYDTLVQKWRPADKAAAKTSAPLLGNGTKPDSSSPAASSTRSFGQTGGFLFGNSTPSFGNVQKDLSGAAKQADLLAKEKAEKAEKEKFEKMQREEAQKAEKERAEKEKAEKEKAEKEKAEKEKAEKEKAEKEKAEKEKAEKEKAEKERAEKERAEKERAEKERAEKEKADKEKADKEKADKEKADKEKAEREKTAKEKAEKEKAQKEKLEKEAEKARREAEKANNEKEKTEKAEREKAQKEQAQKAELEKADKSDRKSQDQDGAEKAEDKPNTPAAAAAPAKPPTFSFQPGGFAFAGKTTSTFMTSSPSASSPASNAPTFSIPAGGFSFAGKTLSTPSTSASASTSAAAPATPTTTSTTPTHSSVETTRPITFGSAAQTPTSGFSFKAGASSTSSSPHRFSFGSKPKEDAAFTNTAIGPSFANTSGVASGGQFSFGSAQISFATQERSPSPPEKREAPDRST